jgi:phosphoribosyl 1,2-cyclic phosphodiesterase
VIFVGTGGGRFVTSTQKRHTGGIRLIHGDEQIHVDPGPGALVYSLNLHLSQLGLGAVLVSHCHLDHYGDAEVMIEAMTRGGTRKQGVLIAPRSVLQGNGNYGAAISRYHKSIVEATYEAKPGEVFRMRGMTIKPTRASHGDPDTVGFRFDFPGIGEIGYTSDTEYFKGISDYYKGVRLLILCVLRPRGFPWKGHISTDEATKIVEEVKPEAAVITHFGMRMIFANPSKEACFVEKKTGIKTFAAVDSMEINVAKGINVKKSGLSKSIDTFKH